MLEPSITSSEKFIPLSDRVSRGSLRFSDYNYVLAYRITVESDCKKAYELPAEVGRFTTFIVDYTRDGSDSGWERVRTTKNCRSLLPEYAEENQGLKF